MDLYNLEEMDIEQLEHLAQRYDQPAYRGRQIFRWIYRGAESIDEMTDLPKSFREALKEHYTIDALSIFKRVISENDDAIKYLFSLHDGNIIEGVLMRYKFGNSVCVSSQVGCSMGCAFCASTIQGMKRNLTRGEMVDQVLRIQKDIGERISHVVLMGSGEPLENYNECIGFMRLVHHEDGLNISYRSMTLSTCGIVPRIYDLAHEGIPITLAVSLHAPSDDIRRQIMPIAKRYSINEIINACRYYASVSGRRVTFEYILLKDINDKAEHAHQLADILQGMLCHVNIIPYNRVKERSFEPSSSKTVQAFYAILKKRSIPVSIRRRLGSEIDAACGQLRRRFAGR